MIDYRELTVQKYWSFPKSFKGDPKTEVRNMIFSGNYIGSRKMDGAFYKFWKDENGNMELLGRSKSVSGDYLNKIDWVPQFDPFFKALPNGTCLIGEVYFPHNEGSRNVTTIMGCLVDKARARQDKGDKLHYYVFDVLAYDGEDFVNKNIEDRVMKLESLEGFFGDYAYIDFAHYHCGETLWNCLQLILNEGGEGVVITKMGTCYQPGKRPARQTLKVKKELKESIDCFFTGRATAPTKDYTGKEIEKWEYWENIITGEKLRGNYYKSYSEGGPVIPVTKSYFLNLAGSLEIGVVKGDKVVPIGYLSGLTEEIKSDPAAYKGRCIEVTAMEIDSTENKGLRHAKLVQFRDDLTIRDCTYEKIFGKE